MAASTVTILATASVTAVAVVGLIIMLVARELSDASERPSLGFLSRDLAVYATPLLIAFAFIVVMQVLEAID